MNAAKFMSHSTYRSTSQSQPKPAGREIYIGRSGSWHIIHESDISIAQRETAKATFNIISELKGFLNFANWKRINGHADRAMFRSLMNIATHYGQQPESINIAAAQMLLEIEEENA